MLIMMSGGSGKGTAKNIQKLQPPEGEVSFGIKSCEYSSREMGLPQQVDRESKKDYTEVCDRSIQNPSGEWPLFP